MNWFLAKPATLAAWSALCFTLGLILAPPHWKPVPCDLAASTEILP